MKIHLWVAAVLAISIQYQAAAQGAPPGAGQMQAGGEWAIGRWEGQLLRIGSSTAKRANESRTLIVERSASGATTCQFFPPGSSKGSTKRCEINASGISITTSSDAELELSRSGQDAAKGTFMPRLAQSAGAVMGGMRVHLRRASNAASLNYSWTTFISLESGEHRHCGSPPYANHKVEVNGFLLRGTPVAGESKLNINAKVDLRPLKADGSGSLSVTDEQGRPWHWDLEAGTGPRKIHIRQDYLGCAYLWSPT